MMDCFSATSQSDADALFRTLLEANLATEVGMVTLDVVCLYCQEFKVSGAVVAIIYCDKISSLFLEKNDEK